jgi:hypothetical protein
MKKLLFYVSVAAAVFSLPFWIMACRAIAPYLPADISPDHAFLATAQIYRTINGSGDELTEEWQSWIYVPKDAYGQYPAQEYAAAKIGEYISESLAPGFSWHYRNLDIKDADNMSLKRNTDGADCANVISPRTHGGPGDNRIVFDHPDSAYSYVTVYTKDDSGAIVDEVRVPVKYAEVAFAERPGIPSISNWDTLLDRHLRFPDIYMELENFTVNVIMAGHVESVSIASCSVKNIGTVTASYTGSSYTVQSAKFYMYWEESTGDRLRFCVQGGSSLQAGGTASWDGTYDSFSFGLTLGPDDMRDSDTDEGLPLQLDIHLVMPAGPGNSYNSHQPSVLLPLEKTVYAPSLPVSVNVDPLTRYDKDDMYWQAPLFWIEDYQDPSSEKLLAQNTPSLAHSFTSYGPHSITLVDYDFDGGFNTSTMIINIKPPEIVITSPNGGECLETGAAPGSREREITWTGGGVGENVSISLSCNDNDRWYSETIAELTPNDGSFTWTMPAENHNDCYVLIWTDAGVWDETDSTFSIVAADSCYAAGPVTAGNHVGSLECASNDGGSFCESPADQPDVWYRFTAQCAGNLIVNTCGTHDLGGVDSGIDTVVSIHTRCPAMPIPGVDVCNDDWDDPVQCSEDQGAIRDSIVSMTMSQGSSALIRVSKYSSREDRYFLNIYFPYCPGDLSCDGDVDGQDIVSFAGLFAKPCPSGGWCRGDFNTDGRVDDLDLKVLASSFGNTDIDECLGLTEME